MKRELALETIEPVRSWERAAVETLAVAGLMSLSAWGRIPLPFSPVPITLQTFVVLTAGFLVGQNRATAGMLVYVTCGVLGAPVLAVPFGPTFGYLLAFVATPCVVGKFRNTAVGMTVATLVIYVMGAAWLGLWLRCSIAHAVALGVLPYLAGDALKAVAAAKFAQYLRHSAD